MERKPISVNIDLLSLTMSSPISLINVNFETRTFNKDFIRYISEMFYCIESSLWSASASIHKTKVQNLIAIPSLLNKIDEIKPFNSLKITCKKISNKSSSMIFMRKNIWIFKY
jgi:hypothetical protein